MKPAPHQALADAIGEATAGQLQARRFLDELRGGHPDPDALYWLHLQVQVTPDRLRGFLRAVQKQLERGAADA